MPVAADRREVRFQLEPERQVLLLEQRLDGGAHLADEGVHVDLLVAPLDPAGLHLGEVEQVVDEGGEAFALGDDDVEVPADLGHGPAGRVVGGGDGGVDPFVEALRDDLGEPEDRGQGGSQLVGDRRDEVGLHPVDLSLDRDVAHEDDGPAGRLLGRVDDVAGHGAAETPVGEGELAGRGLRGPDPVQLGEDLGRRLVQQAPRRPGQHLLEPPVDALDASLGVDDEEPLGEVVENRCELVAETDRLVPGAGRLLAGALQLGGPLDDLVLQRQLGPVQLGVGVPEPVDHLGEATRVRVQDGQPEAQEGDRHEDEDHLDELRGQSGDHRDDRPNRQQHGHDGRHGGRDRDDEERAALHVGDREEHGEDREHGEAAEQRGHQQGSHDELQPERGADREDGGVDASGAVEAQRPREQPDAEHRGHQQRPHEGRSDHGQHDHEDHDPGAGGREVEQDEPAEPAV